MHSRMHGNPRLIKKQELAYFNSTSAKTGK